MNNRKNFSMNRADVEQLWNEFHTPTHVRGHCRQVAMVGKFLAEHLKKKGIKVDPEEVCIAGLIHDFVRIVDFKHLPEDLGTPGDQIFWKTLRAQYRGWHHADAGAEILEKKGEVRLASIVRHHKFDSITSDDPPTSWEEKLLYYADKRVTHEKIVSLEERLREGRMRHHDGAPLTEDDHRKHAAIQALEREIFKNLDFGPEKIY